jgi:hypothetical protein
MKTRSFVADVYVFGPKGRDSKAQRQATNGSDALGRELKTKCDALKGRNN